MLEILVKYVIFILPKMPKYFIFQAKNAKIFYFLGIKCQHLEVKTEKMSHFRCIQAHILLILLLSFNMLTKPPGKAFPFLLEAQNL